MHNYTFIYLFETDYVWYPSGPTRLLMFSYSPNSPIRVTHLIPADVEMETLSSWEAGRYVWEGRVGFTFWVPEKSTMTHGLQRPMVLKRTQGKPVPSKQWRQAGGRQECAPGPALWCPNTFLDFVFALSPPHLSSQHIYHRAHCPCICLLAVSFVIECA